MTAVTGEQRSYGGQEPRPDLRHEPLGEQEIRRVMYVEVLCGHMLVLSGHMLAI